MLGLIGKKLGMTQRFVEGGNLVPVTVIETGPCTVVQVRTTDRDGYDALQVGFGTRREKNLSKARKGHANKAGRANFASLLEFRLREAGDWQIGQELRLAEMFKAGDFVDVTGTSKGKGFQGVMKRHNFAGGRSSHGSMFHRAPGSIGSSAYPSRVFPGMRGTGRMGGERVTVKNLQVVKVDAENNLIYLRGAVPGPKSGYLTICRAKRG
jgi:large subunit ribosomal protein L3